MLVNRNAPAIIDDPDGAILIECDLDGGAVPCHELVHRIIDDLYNQVVKATLVCTADVHTRTPPDCLHTLENLNVGCCVLVVP